MRIGRPILFEQLYMKAPTFMVPQLSRIKLLHTRVRNFYIDHARRHLSDQEGQELDQSVSAQSNGPAAISSNANSPFHARQCGRR